MQCILKDNGKLIPRCSPRPNILEDIHSGTEKNKREIFGRFIEGRWGAFVNQLPTSDTKNESNFEE